ncbi:MAG: citrate transporter [Desulfobacterales bacterium]|nr:citrate transporter [Desulfobacterales bacterium]
MKWIAAVLLTLFPTMALASSGVPSIGPIRLEFIIFALTLVGVATLHKHAMQVALTGLVLVVLTKYIFAEHFSLLHHIIGGNGEEGEWRVLLNLLGLLFGFAILAKHFEESKLPDVLPNYLPGGWKGGFALLALICILSSFLDNIAAAMIGGTIALVVFKGKVHIGYLAAIVAASNAGGAPSVVGDTTTTLMWIAGVSPLAVIHAAVAALASILIIGYFGAKQQHAHQPIVKNKVTVEVEWVRIAIVFFILVCAIATNYLLDFPALGVWVAILLGAMISKTPWEEIKNAWRGTVFLMALIACASLMPVEELPAASPWTAFGLGFVSAVFDNIPLTKLCLDQGGYDWGCLAYSVGFGGSMIWFGSSAGVALSNKFPEAKNTWAYVKNGWHVTAAYVISFFIMWGVMGWHPTEIQKETAGVRHTQEAIVPAPAEAAVSVPAAK